MTLPQGSVPYSLYSYCTYQPCTTGTAIYPGALASELLLWVPLCCETCRTNVPLGAIIGVMIKQWQKGTVETTIFY